MSCKWDEFYDKCPEFSEFWKNCNEKLTVWHDNFKLRGNPVQGYKLFCKEKLCIPYGLCAKVVAAQHIKLVQELKLRHHFGCSQSPREFAQHVKCTCKFAKLQIGL